MKAKVLLDLFTPKEHLLFEKTVIRLHKRKRLKKLYQVLKKELPPSKEVLYKKVFEVPYEDKKDALLRNELRLLSNAVELFLVQQRELAQINLQQYATKLSLLHIYAERQQWDYFEQLWQRLYKTAVQEQVYQQQIELVQLWLKEKLLIGENSEALFQEIKTQLNITQTAIWARFQEEYYRLRVKQGFVERNLYALNPRYNATLPDYPAPSPMPLPNQPSINFLRLWADSYLLHGSDKIQQLEQALDYEPYLQQHAAYHDLYDDTISIRSNIAIEYFLQKKYAQANVTYQQLLVRIKEFSPNRKSAFLYNYMVNLVCLGSYQKALDLHRDYQETFSENDRVKYRALYFKAWAHILLKQYPQALDVVLKSQPQDRPHQDAIYGRMLLSILYSMLGELEMAERELYNIKQKHQYNALQEPFFVGCAGFFYRLAQVRYLPPSDKKKQKIQLLQAELHEQYGQGDNTTGSTLMLRWFQQVTDKLLGKGME